MSIVGVGMDLPAIVSVKLEVRFWIDSVPVALARGRKMTSRAAVTLSGASPEKLTRKLMNAVLLAETGSVFAVPAAFAIVPVTSVLEDRERLGARRGAEHSQREAGGED